MPIAARSDSDSVRHHAVDVYLRNARRQGETTFSINVGEVHRALGFHNRVPLVCAALTSKKFLSENELRLISRTGPPSGQSTTVTYSYEILGGKRHSSTKQDSWAALRGTLKGVFADLGGGESYLRKERDSFNISRERK